MKMKHYIIENCFGVFEYYVGSTTDIKALYGSIRRNKVTWLRPLFAKTPIFSDNKQVYALCIDQKDYVTVVNSDTMLSILLDKNNEIEEI